MALLTYEQAVMFTPGLKGFWLMDTSAMPNALVDLPDMTAGASPGTFGQSSIIPGWADGTSVVHTARDSSIGYIPDHALFDQSLLTVGAWCRIDTLYNEQSIWFSNTRFYLTVSSNPYRTPYLKFAWKPDQPPGTANDVGGPNWVIAPGDPFFAVAVFDGTSKHLYLNGVRVASSPQTGTLAASTDPLYLGYNPALGGVLGFVGAIQAPFFATGVSSDAHIRSLYEIGMETQAEAAGKRINAMPWSRVALPADPDRVRAYLTNASDTPVWVSHGPLAEIGAGILLPPFGARTYKVSNYTGEVSVISDNHLGGKAVALEVITA